MKKALVLFGCVALSGCATTVVPTASGGSRSDGTVEMSYEYGAMMVPQVDYATAKRTAVRRCQAWGYKDAESFDTGLKKCSAPSVYGCDAYRVTIQYQCIHEDDMGFKPATLPTPTQSNSSAAQTDHREELRMIQESMSCNQGAKIVKKTAESTQWELNCGDGETLEVRCFEDDCYLR